MRQAPVENRDSTVTASFFDVLSTKNDGPHFFDDVHDGAPNTIKSITFQNMTFIKPSKINTFTKAPDKHQTSTVLAPEKH